MNRIVSTGVWALAVALVLTGCSGGGGGKATSNRAARTTTTSAPPAASRDLAITKETNADLPGFNIRRPADLDATGAPLPVVVWANGGCVRFDGTWQAVLERWAKAGFFVISIEGGDVVTMSTADDQARAIDWAFEQNEVADDPYAGHLDVERVVAAGNSCGGITALELASEDSRVRAVFVLSGSSVAPGGSLEAVAAIMGKVKVPVGYAVGGPEDIAGAEATKDYNALPDGVPRYIARRSSGDHQTVSTNVEMQTDAAEIGINWMDFALFGNETAKLVLLDTACSGCARGLWTPTAKNLDS